MNEGGRRVESGMPTSPSPVSAGDAAPCFPDVGVPNGVVVIDVGATKVAAAFVMVASGNEPHVLWPCVVPSAGMSSGAGGTVADAVVQAACSVLDKMHAAVGVGDGSSLPSCRVAGIGVAARGQVDLHDGSILDDGDLLPGWKGTPIAALLRERFALPVAVVNDAQAHALGEARWGAGRHASSCLLVACGTGLGGGIVVDGHLLLGAHGAAGHIGHTLYAGPMDSVCSCGRFSHIESVASGSGIESMYQVMVSVGSEAGDRIGGAEIARRAQAGEDAACTVLRQAGYALGQAVGSWVNAIDPGLVILSGSVCGAGDLWRASLDEGFASQVLAPLADTPVVLGHLGCDAALVGAAEFLLDSLPPSSKPHLQA